MNYSNLSDFDINKLVAESVGYLVQEIDDNRKTGMTTQYHERHPNAVWIAELDCTTGEQSTPWEQYSPANTPADTWPLIIENEISILFCGDTCEVSYDYEAPHGSFGTDETFTNSIECKKGKVLRAACICYLMKNEGLVCT